MIKIVESGLFDTKAQIIVQLVNDDGDLRNNIPSYINDEYHHVTKEYIRFINHYQKKNKNTIGLVQYTPVDVWALGLVDTIKNDYIDTYDKDFKYIACAFARTREGKKYIIDFDALKECLRNICNKAQSVKADVAIVYSSTIEQAVKEVFVKSTVNVYLCKES